MARHRPTLAQYTQFSLTIADDNDIYLTELEKAAIKMAAVLKTRSVFDTPPPRSVRLIKKFLEDTDQIVNSLSIRQIVPTDRNVSNFFAAARTGMEVATKTVPTAAGLVGRGLDNLADRGLLGETDRDFEETSKTLSEIAVQSVEAVESVSRVGGMSAGHGVLVTHEGLAWAIKPAATALGLLGAAALAPLLLAMAPWIGVCKVLSMREKNYALKDLKQGRHSGMCLCGTCDRLLKVVVDRSDWDLVKVPCAVFVGPLLFLWVAGRKAVNYRRFSERDRVATMLWESTAGRLRTTEIVNRQNRNRSVVASTTRIPCPKAMRILGVLCGPFEAAAVLAAEKSTSIAHLKELV